MDARLLVTGGASGIGRAVVDAGLAHGWDVVVLDRQPADAVRTVLADLADPASAADALAEVLDDGPVTRLVNNVGAVFPARLEDQALDQVDSSFALNLRCAVQCTQAVLPGMRAAGFGRVVNMSSRAALGKAERTAYAAAKAGLLGLTRVWALELGPAGVTVNAVGPGPIATPLFEAANDEQTTRAIVDAVPVRRMGTPEDVAHAVDFFLADQAGFVTGQVLYVCGGLTVGSATV
ncbi:SDR family oxidoreductase [Klenkia taihuensis]|uniref:NAD(P)-dependent dehydrogenase, short-chain alcohol dehydrogenase family n=1 Tax=Klenkia taihuensis TaxID=1225127 RepID=A0A1I1U415_9ACTN|nr:SDR family oxidoreductase [Klenkia taihuensis]GHE07007.1 short-chain dehydrogenase [Klenkia taihuensis]SFD64348.1 NAD(P)-dependent dehydrogenase, short-chain alcohol dehydrogenase family [Klenkia taihuensis]